MQPRWKALLQRTPLLALSLPMALPTPAPEIGKATTPVGPAGVVGGTSSSLSFLSSWPPGCPPRASPRFCGLNPHPQQVLAQSLLL
jgi:hypothetical protein